MIIERILYPITISNESSISIDDLQTGSSVNITPLGEIKAIEPSRLVGTAFSNGTKDTNFWTETVTGSGSVTQTGAIILATGSTADSTASYTTVRKARKVTGSTNQFRAVARNIQDVSADCIRRIGAYGSTDGFFAQFDGVTFGVGVRKNSVDTVIENGNFNGNAGSTIELDDTEFIRIVIEYTSLSVKYFINGTLIHTILATSGSLTNTQDLQATLEIINENGNTDNNGFEVLFATILRLGKLETENQYKYIGTNGTTVCKYGAGRLKRITNLDNAGSATIYDGITTGGTLIASIDTAKALGTLDFDVPFNDGLTIVTATGAKVTVIYE